MVEYNTWSGVKEPRVAGSKTLVSLGSSLEPCNGWLNRGCQANQGAAGSPLNLSVPGSEWASPLRLIMEDAAAAKSLVHRDAGTGTGYGTGTGIGTGTGNTFAPREPPQAWKGNDEKLELVLLGFLLK